MNKKHFFTKEKFIKEKRGFTLIEMLAAVSIFSIAILAMIAVFSADLKSINYSKKKLIATYLASEGIEYMRSRRDTYGLYDVTQVPAIDGWTAFKNKILTDCNVANSCYLDIDHLDSNPAQSYNIFSTTNMPITNVLISACPVIGCPAFYYHVSSGRYDYLPSGGTPTDFHRSIVVNVIGSDELQIISTVTWEQGSGVKSISFYDHLLNQIQ